MQIWAVKSIYHSDYYRRNSTAAVNRPSYLWITDGIIHHIDEPEWRNPEERLLTREVYILASSERIYGVNV